MENQQTQQNFNPVQPPKKKGGCLKIGLIAIAVIAGIWFFLGGGIEQQAQQRVDQISNQVALDAEKQYDIVVNNNGTAIEKYTQASLVAAAYLQAKDEENYKKWKEIEKTHAKEAGLNQ